MDHQHPSLLSQILAALDIFAMMASPFAVIGFIAFGIMALDAFGSHVQFFSALEHEGVVATGRLISFDRSDTYAFVQLDRPAHGLDSVNIRIRDYPAALLDGLREGQNVRVRYLYPPEHESRAVFEDSYPQLRDDPGYLSEYFWPLMVCWLVLVIHPEVLYFGLSDNQKAAATPETR